MKIKDGMCIFIGSIPLETDILKFEETVEAAGKSREAEKGIQLFGLANEMYHGELLPTNLSDAWFFQKSNYYKELYLETVRELEKEFRERKDYKNLIAIYTRAASIYPFENWQTKLIHCNLEVYRYEEAMSIYNSTMELYAREMGSPNILKHLFESIKQLFFEERNSGGKEMKKKQVVKILKGVLTVGTVIGGVNVMTDADMVYAAELGMDSTEPVPELEAPASTTEAAPEVTYLESDAPVDMVSSASDPETVIPAEPESPETSEDSTEIDQNKLSEEASRYYLMQIIFVIWMIVPMSGIEISAAPHSWISG